MSASPPDNESLLQALMGLMRDLPLMLSHRIELLSLELKLAGQALARMVVLAVAAAVFGATAWMLLWAGIVMTMLDAGMQRSTALLVALAANVLAACLAMLFAYRLSSLLTLPATRRHLTVAAAAEPEPSAAAAPAAPAAESTEVPADGKPAL